MEFQREFGCAEVYQKKVKFDKKKKIYFCVNTNSAQKRNEIQMFYI